MRNRRVFDKLVRAEKEFVGSEFVAPIFSDKVVVAIEGFLCSYRVQPNSYRGWAKLEVQQGKIAKVVDDVPRHAMNTYLRGLGKFRVMICDVEKSLGFILNTDDRLDGSDPIKIQLGKNLGLADVVDVGFDGAHFIYVNHVRGSYNRLKIDIERLLDKGLSIEQLDNKMDKRVGNVYEYCYIKKIKDETGKTEKEIRNQIKRGGGKYIGHKKLDDNQISIDYTIGGRRYSSVINKDLDLISAGICLSGGDRAFDLQSLMTVVREGQNRSAIYED